MVESKKLKGSFKAYEKKALIIINEVYDGLARENFSDLPIKEKQDIIDLFEKRLEFNT